MLLKEQKYVQEGEILSMAAMAGYEFKSGLSCEQDHIFKVQSKRRKKKEDE